MSANSGARPRNRILAALPAEEYARLLPHLKPVRLEYKQVLYEPLKAIRYSYFPEDSVVSMVSTVTDKATRRPTGASCKPRAPP